MINTHSHTHKNIEPQNGLRNDLYCEEVPCCCRLPKSCVCVENNIKCKKYKEQMKRRYIVTDLLRLIYFFIYELVIIQIFCKTKFSECSARERGKNG